MPIVEKCIADSLAKCTSFAISWVIVRYTLTAIILHNNRQGHNIMFHICSWSKMISRSSYRLFDIVQVALAKCCSKKEVSSEGLCTCATNRENQNSLIE